MKQLDDTDINVKEDRQGLSRSQRQMMQIEKARGQDDSIYIDHQGAHQEIKSWKYPLHMIDFETCRVAIPFNKGLHPYEQIAFQFSHHILKENGEIEHVGEFLESSPGVFPNFDFVRELKKQLSSDQGTIFRYSHHENTVLCEIREQLLQGQEKDKEELISFIESITTKKGQWDGDRSMIDLCNLVHDYYFDPATKGSNSLKFILPSVLRHSKFLQEKYKKLQYNSKNFENHQWIKIINGEVQNPYDSLDAIFADQEKIERLLDSDDIKNGGAALTAYAKMQFGHMSDRERQQVSQALLRYCELDTLAMVMLVQAFQHWIKERLSNAA